MSNVTEWAYAQACRAIEKHRARADKAEAELKKLRKAAHGLSDFAWSGVRVTWDDGETYSVPAMKNLQRKLNRVRTALGVNVA